MLKYERDLQSHDIISHDLNIIFFPLVEYVVVENENKNLYYFEYLSDFLLVFNNYLKYENPVHHHIPSTHSSQPRIDHHPPAISSINRKRSQDSIRISAVTHQSPELCKTPERFWSSNLSLFIVTT